MLMLLFNATDSTDAADSVSHLKSTGVRAPYNSVVARQYSTAKLRGWPLFVTTPADRSCNFGPKQKIWQPRRKQSDYGSTGVLHIHMHNRL